MQCTKSSFSKVRLPTFRLLGNIKKSGYFANLVLNNCSHYTTDGVNDGLVFQKSTTNRLPSFDTVVPKEALLIIRTQQHEFSRIFASPHGQELMSRKKISLIALVVATICTTLSTAYAVYNQQSSDKINTEISEESNIETDGEENTLSTSTSSLPNRHSANFQIITCLLGTESYLHLL